MFVNSEEIIQSEMSKKQKTKNTKLNSIKKNLDTLEVIVKKPKLFEYLRQLFIANGFKHVLITHRVNEKVKI